MTPIEYFKFTYGLRDEDLFLIPYGSRVYGTFSEKSDYDYHAIVPANRKADTGTEYRSEELNIHIFNSWDWQQQLNRHKIHTLEGFFHWDGVVAQNFTFKLDLKILRDEISTKASHSFVKAKKKIELEKDYYIGWKSLFHSLRILDFGTQVARDGKITNFGSANQHWWDILAAQQYNWAYFKDKYQPIYNKMASEFKRLAPK